MAGFCAVVASRKMLAIEGLYPVEYDNYIDKRNDVMGEAVHADNRPQRNALHIAIIAVTTVATILVSLFCLFSGFFVLFQNLFYIPIVLSCLYYTIRGLIYSVFLSLLYLLLILTFTSDGSIVVQALARVGMFVIIAAIITLLSERRKVAMERVYENEKTFRRLFEESTDPVLLLDSQRFIDCNAAAVAILGYLSKDDILNKTPWDLSPEYQPDGRQSSEKAQEVMEIAVQMGHHRLEWVCVTSKGVPLILDIMLTPIVIKRTRYLYTVWRDITDRKKAEEALKQSRALLANIIEFLPDATFVIDLEGKVISWNRAIEEMTGLSAQTIVGKGNYEYSMPFYGVRRPMLIDLLFAWDVDISKRYSFIRQRGETFLTETDLPSVRGQRRTLWAAATLLRDAQGNITGAIESIRDITDRKEAEEQLHRSEAKYRSIFDNAVEGIFQTVPEGRFLNVNKAMADIHGFSSPEEMMAVVADIGSQLYVNPEDRKRYRYFLERDGEVKNFEAQVYRKDGSVVWTSVNARSVKNPLGYVSMFEGTAVDITSRRLAENSLRESRNELQWLFRSMINAFVLFESVFDESGIFVSYRFVYINDAYERITGVTNDQVRGKTVHEVWPNTEPEWVKRYGEVAVTGTPSTFDLYHEPTKKLYHCNVYRPWETRDRFCVIFEDITDRKIAEEKLRASEQKFRSIFENTVEGIFQTTPDGRLLSVNPAFSRMAGYCSPEHMIEKVADLSRQAYVDFEDWLAFKRAVEEKGHVESYEVRHYRKDGATFWGSINARCVYDDGDNPLYYEGTCEDITKRRLAQEELRETLEKLRGRLIDIVRVLSSTVEMRDPYTAGHQKRVSMLATAIAEEMGLSGDVVDNIRMAGAMHDIGKISIPVEILTKPGKMSDIERRLMMMHPESGYEILKDIELPYPIALIVRQHHERMNGSGYPHGLKGEEILLESRIVGIADVTEAISSHRPYRAGLGIEAALGEIELNRGMLYDGVVADVCIQLFRRKGYAFA